MLDNMLIRSLGTSHSSGAAIITAEAEHKDYLLISQNFFF